MATLACGPYFSATGIITSLALLVIAKPLVYAFFVLCFRYRVTTPAPLNLGRVLGIAALRAVIGVGLLAAAWGVLQTGLLGRADEPVAWGLLLAERAVVWLAIGFLGVHLRGRRLLGWTLSGLGIDAAFDVTVAASVIGGPVVAIGLVLALVAFLVPLFLIGRRPSLKARFFAANICRGCGYDLTGNASGICPECGTAIPRASAAA